MLINYFKYLYTLLGICVIVQCRSQEVFTYLQGGDADSSYSNVYFTERPDGSILSLNQIFHYVKSPGAPSFSVIKHGTAFTQISATGEKLKENILDLDHLPGTDPNADQVLPAYQFEEGQNSIKLSYNPYVGFLQCGNSGAYNDSYRSGQIELTNDGLQIVSNHVYLTDTACPIVNLLGYASFNNGTSLFLEQDNRTYSQRAVLRKDSQDIWVKSLDNTLYFDWRLHNWKHDEIDQSIVLQCRSNPFNGDKSLCKVDSSGTLTAICGISEWSELADIEITTEYYHLLLNFRDSISGKVTGSSIYQISRNEHGNISSFYIDTVASVDMELKENDILVLSALATKINTLVHVPLRVYYISSGIRRYFDLGLKTWRGVMIRFTMDDTYTVSGTSHLSWLDGEEDRPNQLFITKRKLAEIAKMVGITENKEISALQIFPNPANDKLTVNFQSGSVVNGIKVLDYLGRTVQLIKNKDQATQLVIDCSSLDAGVYILSTDINGEAKTFKVVVNH